MVHSLFTTGSFHLMAAVAGAAGVSIEKRDGTLNELHGRLGFIDGIDLYNKELSKKDYAPTSKSGGRLSKKELMYKQFLIDKDFYAAPAPVILCEGETDNIYLTHAIRSLAAGFPELAEIDQKGKIRLKVRLYKYARSSTARILGLNDGGASQLNSFIVEYKKETERFKAPGGNKPVVILYDNDTVSASVRSTIKSTAVTAFEPTKPYSHIVRNLYAMQTPLPAGASESKIEDFVDAATTATVLGGKTFNANNAKNGFDSTQHYGKKIFASQVEHNAATINFDGFKPLLTTLESIIKAHL